MPDAWRPDDRDDLATRDFSVDDGRDPSPWYLTRWALILWGLAVIILIATIIYGLAILARGNGGAPAPSTTHPSTTSSSSTTTTALTPSSTSPTTPSTDTTIEPSPGPTSTPWTSQHPHHHWWRSNLPPIPPIPHF